jgi:hypothetical protein
MGPIHSPGLVRSLVHKHDSGLRPGRMLRINESDPQPSHLEHVDLWPSPPADRPVPLR